MTPSIHRVTTLDAYEALAPAWEQLVSKSGQGSPFLTHEWFGWFGCCWRAAGPEQRPEVLWPGALPSRCAPTSTSPSGSCRRGGTGDGLGQVDRVIEAVRAEAVGAGALGHAP